MEFQEGLVTGPSRRLVYNVFVFGVSLRQWHAVGLSQTETARCHCLDVAWLEHSYHPGVACGVCAAV